MGWESHIWCKVLASKAEIRPHSKVQPVNFICPKVVKSQSSSRVHICQGVCKYLGTCVWWERINQALNRAARAWAQAQRQGLATNSLECVPICYDSPATLPRHRAPPKRTIAKNSKPTTVHVQSGLIQTPCPAGPYYPPPSLDPFSSSTGSNVQTRSRNYITSSRPT
jgi:hypothetical protein